MCNTNGGMKPAIFNLKNIRTALLKGTSCCISQYLTCRRYQNLVSEEHMIKSPHGGSPLAFLMLSQLVSSAFTLTMPKPFF